jgi:hypothetical protein
MMMNLVQLLSRLFYGPIGKEAIMSGMDKKQRRELLWTRASNAFLFIWDVFLIFGKICQDLETRVGFYVVDR